MDIRNNAAVYHFQKKKYLPVDNFMDEAVAKHITDQYVALAKADTANKLRDDQCPVNSKAWYGQPKCEYVMVDCLPKVEELTGLKLFPTYTYMRVYGPGELLHQHQDRPSCEISVTINLGQSNDFDWPIWYADPEDLTIRMPVSVPPLSAMVYRGCEVPHWRDELITPETTDWQCQLFLHYVDRHGPCSQSAYDRREKLFIEPIGTSEVYKILQARTDNDRLIRFDIVKEEA
tara:strand:+ start:73 stop:768 length:696 start_codon:yes stop_codon:yes gene_type:complete